MHDGMRRLVLLLPLLLLPAVYACSGPPQSAIELSTPTPTATSSPHVYDAGAPPADADVEAEAEASAPVAVPPISTATPAASPVTCATGEAPQAYLLSTDGTLFAFDPSTLDTRALGTLACPSQGTPARMTVSQAGVAYVLYSSGDIDRVDLTSLDCTTTPYAEPPAYDPRVSSTVALALSATTGSDRLFMYGLDRGPDSVPAPATLGVSDVSSFLVLPVGAISPPEPQPRDVQFDAFGRMFTFAQDGTLTEIDPATATAVGQDSTGFDGSNGWAMMADDGQLYFFGGGSGAISRYDLGTKTLSPLGQVNQIVAGASAAPCMAPAAAIQDPDGGAPAAPANPFSAGDAWIGTYSCDYNSGTGLTNAVLLVDSVAGNSVVARLTFAAELESGTFDVTGTFDPVTREAVFTPGAWAPGSPESSSTVGMDGYIDLGGHLYAGNVSAQECGSFSVQR